MPVDPARLATGVELGDPWFGQARDYETRRLCSDQERVIWASAGAGACGWFGAVAMGLVTDAIDRLAALARLGT